MNCIWTYELDDGSYADIECKTFNEAYDYALICFSDDCSDAGIKNAVKEVTFVKIDDLENKNILETFRTILEIRNESYDRYP